MVLLEYIIAQHQDANISVAISSKKVREQNPALVINIDNENVIWKFRGLHLGEIETIQGDARVTRFDFYIGMEDLIEQRQNFPNSIGTSLGNVDGLRIPVGTEKSGGKRIRWNGPVGRVEIQNILATIPPFKIKKDEASSLIFNVDRESSPFPLMSDGGNQTMRELHLGIEHNYIITQNNSITIPRIKLEMNQDQYATILEFIDRSIEFYNNI